MRIWWMLCGRRGAEEVVEVWSLEMGCTVSRSERKGEVGTLRPLTCKEKGESRKVRGKEAISTKERKLDRRSTREITQHNASRNNKRSST
jgi:hypothetical protein